MPNSAVCCLHFALTYGKATTGEDHVLHKGAFWQSRGSIGSVGLSFAGNDTDKDQARSPRGSTPCCREKNLFSTVLIYWQKPHTLREAKSQKHLTDLTLWFAGKIWRALCHDLPESWRKWRKIFTLKCQTAICTPPWTFSSKQSRIWAAWTLDTFDEVVRKEVKSTQKVERLQRTAETD